MLCQPIYIGLQLSIKALAFSAQQQPNQGCVLAEVMFLLHPCGTWQLHVCMI